MGFTTHIYRCDKCNKEFIYTSRQSHPTTYHKCKIKPVKQMNEKDFNHMNLVLSGDAGIDATEKQYQYEYWQKRINIRIEYLTPLINECNSNGYDLATISKELHKEWLELHEIKRFYKF